VTVFAVGFRKAIDTMPFPDRRFVSLVAGSKIAACALTVACAVLTVGSSARASDPEVPTIVDHAARTFAQETRGVVGFQRHSQTRIRGGPVSHSESSDSGFVMADGAYAKIKYERVVQDGNTFDAAKLDARNSETNDKWSRGQVFFKEPYEQRYLADYSYTQVSKCADCAPGSVVVSYVAKVRDEQHGDGTMWIDLKSGHVLKSTYSPNVLPQHATWETATETGGRALADLWYVTGIDEQYRGHIAFVSGSATFTTTFDHFRRFKSLKSALEALDNSSL